MNHLLNHNQVYAEDATYEMQITVGEQTVMCEVGIASEDGSTSQVGVGVVTPERIPLLFYADGKFLNVTFEKQN